jgi:hypothetical protein
MKLFGLPEARHYCRGFSPAHGTGLAATGSVKDLLNSKAATPVLAEGSADFNAYRACALRDVERCMFLAASLYRRAFDLMSVSAAGWAHVTLYYGTFYSAKALLGMFGAYIDVPRWRVEVQTSKPGGQELIVTKNPRGTPGWGTYTGSHERFWDNFYRAVAPLQPFIDPKLAFALLPVSARPDWLTAERNSVNYNPAKSLTLSRDFQTSFRRSKARTSLPGTMNTQFLILEGVLRITFALGRQVGVATDALNLLAPVAVRPAKLRRLVFDAQPPNLDHIVRRRGLCC